MTVRLNPYLGFRDTAREAMGYYRSVFGGELELSTYAQFAASKDAAEQDTVMHAVLTAPGGLVLMASDTPNTVDLPAGSGHAVSLSGDAADESMLRGYWGALAETALAVPMPMERAPWGDLFGMCVDRFGVSWSVDIPVT